MADFRTQRAERIVNNFFTIGAKEYNVAVLRAGTLDGGAQRRLGKVFDDGRLQAGVIELRNVVDLDVGKTLGAVNLDKISVSVDLAARNGRATGNAQRGNTAAGGIGRPAEHLERDFLHRIGEFSELQRYAQIGFVRTVEAHRIGEFHHRNGVGQLNVDGLLEDGADHGLHQVADFLLAEEGGLDIDLRELGLAIGAQILVAKTFRDLIIAIKTGHHQHLLEQLGRLRQRVELALVDARGHQELTRTLRGRFVEHRRFNVDEAVGVHVLAHGHCHTVAQHQVLLHRRAAQVDYAVFQAYGLGEVFVVKLERRRERRIEDFNLMRQHFDLAAEQVGVDRAFGAPAHDAGDLEHKLVTHRFGSGESFLAVRVGNDLHHAFAIAQVDEDDPTMVTAPVRPAAKYYGLAEFGGADFTAVVSTHFGGGWRMGNGKWWAVLIRPAAHYLQFTFHLHWVPLPLPLLPGTTTPMEMTYLSASSTLMSSSITSDLGIIRKKPEVGLGVVGT